MKVGMAPYSKLFKCMVDTAIICFNQRISHSFGLAQLKPNDGLDAFWTTKDSSQWDRTLNKGNLFCMMDFM